MMSGRSIVSYDKDLPEIPDRALEAHLPPKAYLRKRPGTADEFEVVDGRRPSSLLLVNHLRKEVGHWREEGYPGASEVTWRLFTYWFEEDHEIGGNLFRYYFGQREALETLAYLVDVKENSDAVELVEEFGEVLDPDGTQTDLLEEDITIEQAADGRRWVRRRLPGSSAIISQILPSEDLRRYAFKAATGSGKTVVAAMAAVFSYFHKTMVEGSDLSTNFLIVAPNVIVYQRLERDFASGRIFHELPLIPPEWRPRWTLKTILRGEGTEPDTSGNLFLTNIHQLYDSGEDGWTAENAIEALLGRAPVGDLSSGGRSMLERVKTLPDLVVMNDEAHHVHDEKLLWNTTLAEIHEALPEGFSLWLDFSATPRDQNGTHFPWILTDYPLAQAVEDRIVKAPLIVHRVEKADPEEVTRENVVEAYAEWLQAALVRWREHEETYEPLGLKPVLFVMAEKSTFADEIGSWLKSGEAGLNEEEVLVIHTKGDGEIQKDDLDLAREAVRDIDRPENPIKVVVSVLMLREGWDVKNVTVVLGLRPFTAKANILPEQAIGRGLRLMGGAGPDRTQTLEVMGTDAFEDFVRGLEEEGIGVKTVTDPPKAPVKVYPMHDKLDLDIEIPLTDFIYERSYKTLSELDPAQITPLYKRDVIGERSVVRLRMEFAPTETDVHETVLDLEVPPWREMIGSITRGIVSRAHLSGSFARLYPIVRGYVSRRCFGEEVDLEDEAVRSHLSNTSVRERISRHLAEEVGRATVEAKPLSFEGGRLKLSETTEFTWRRNLPLYVAEKTIFNQVATYNDFEKDFARFLDSCPDVVRFSALGNTEQEESGTVFRVNYLKPSGALGLYYPDWVVVQETDGGGVNWIVETKGRVWEGTQAKDAAIAHWCGQVTEATGARWRYARVNQKVFDSRPSWGSFGELISPPGELALALENSAQDDTAVAGSASLPAAVPREVDPAGPKIEPDEESPITAEAAALHACLPDGGVRIKREVLLEEAARHLGYPELTRKMRKPLNEAIRTERKAGRMLAERGRVWRPKRKQS